LANLLGASAVAISDRLAEAGRKTVGAGGATAAALLTIGSRPGGAINDLCRALDLSHSGAVRLVDRLEERGLVSRAPRKDAREVGLRLTASGKGAFERLLAERRAMLQRLLAPLDSNDLAVVERALSRLLGGLPKNRTEAWQICRLCEHSVCRGASCPVGSAVDVLEAEA
jgi:DNA-binding MarR family transcriptional regulator